MFIKCDRFYLFKIINIEILQIINNKNNNCLNNKFWQIQFINNNEI